MTGLIIIIFFVNLLVAYILAKENKERIKKYPKWLIRFGIIPPVGILIAIGSSLVLLFFLLKEMVMTIWNK